MLARKEVSAREIAESVFERIAAVEGRVRAYLTLTQDRAMQQAAAVDEKIARGEPVGPLAGIPLALKDNLCTRGIRTTCASRILHNFIPPYSATVVTRLLAGDCVLTGKTNCDEFAMGSSTENSGFGPSRNPWDVTRVPGGSSGGSAAAVAAGETVIALGSDTGGSIRQPAALCGIVGLKPTYGRVSRYGLVAYASSLDQIGPMARTVEDAALLLNVIAGKDEYDSTSVDVPVPDYTRSCRADVQGLRIGVPREFFAEGVDREVAACVRAAVDHLCSLGAAAEECSMPTIDYCLAAYYIIAPAEASSNLARYDGVKYGHRSGDYAGHIGLMEKTREEGFGAEVKQRIMIGTYALSSGYYDAYYKRAQQVRTLIRRDFDRAFERYDVLITPTSPTVAFRIGEKSDDPLAMKLADVCTLPCNMAGIPGISILCGFSEGLPVGMQVYARPFDEETLFRVAYTYEQTTDWRTMRAML
jgi:aspartyl-tRNA(Asn)/glutamyl-tRNA(Gln) amidotransferase subunit A